MMRLGAEPALALTLSAPETSRAATSAARTVRNIRMWNSPLRCGGADLPEARPRTQPMVGDAAHLHFPSARQPTRTDRRGPGVHALGDLPPLLDDPRACRRDRAARPPHR